MTNLALQTPTLDQFGPDPYHYGHMPRARVTREQFDEMVRSFREKPGRFQPAARAADVHHRTAKRAWERGWDSPAWARPIREVILDEQRAARALNEEAVQAERGARARKVEERELARIDTARERTREAEGVRAAMSSALSLLANLGILSKASIAVSQAAAKDLLKDVAANKVTWRQAMPFIKTLSLVGERATQQLKGAMEAMRLHLGRPQEILGVIDVSGPTTLVDGEAVVSELGEDRLRQAVMDLAEGNVTKDVEALVSWQVERTGRAN